MPNLVLVPVLYPVLHLYCLRGYFVKTSPIRMSTNKLECLSQVDSTDLAQYYE
jgi:hypothetical protein